MVRIRFSILWALAFALLPGVALADIYRYEVDGQVIYTSEPMEGHTPLEVMDDGTTAPVSARSQSGRAAPADANSFDHYIQEASERYTVPFAFIKAVIHVESGFNPGAVSHAGAIGLMQLMPSTAASLDCADPFDARQNIMAGTLFLRTLINQYNGDINLVLAAYNAGSGNVARAGGIPFEATQRYVARVYQHYREYQQALEPWARRRAKPTA
jgi:soluble lytic murein transglycosylase-like protein